MTTIDPSLDWRPVDSDSGWIQAAAWQDGHLYVRYESGMVYRYDDVPHTLFLGLLDAPSADSWVHGNLTHRAPGRVMRKG